MDVESQKQAGMLPFSTRSNAKRNPHVIVGTPPECPHYKSKSGCKWWDRCVSKHTGKVGNDKMVMQLMPYSLKSLKEQKH